MTWAGALPFALAAVAVGLLLLGRVAGTGPIRRLQGPLVLLAVTGLARGGIALANLGGQWDEWSAAAVLLAIGYLIARAVLLAVFDWFLVRRIGAQVPRLAQDIAALIVYLMVTAAVLKASLSVDVATLLVSSAVITVVIGLALQETLGTLLAGLALTWERRLEAGSWISLDGTIAEIEEVGWRSAVLRTRLGDRLLVPNSDLARSRVYLFGRGESAVGIAVTLGVSYTAAPHRVRAVLRRVAEELPLVVPDPAPTVLTKEFADSAIVYEIRLWSYEPWRRAEIVDALLTRAWSALAREGMEIPFPQRTVHMASPRPEVDGLAECREALHRCALFSDLPDEALGVVAERSGVLDFAPGESVVREGEASEALFVVAEGRASVERHGLRVGTVEPGEVFGEIAFLMNVPRAATVRAIGALKVIEIDSDALRALLSEHGHLAEELARRVAELRRAISESTPAEGGARTKRGFAAELLARLQRLVAG